MKKRIIDLRRVQSFQKSDFYKRELLSTVATGMRLSEKTPDQNTLFQNILGLNRSSLKTWKRNK